MWTERVLEFKVPLSRHYTEVMWRRLCESALAQLTFEDLRSVNGELMEEKREVRKGRFHPTQSCLIV